MLISGGGASATTALFSVGGVLSLPSSKDADTGLVSGISGSFGGWLCSVINIREILAAEVVSRIMRKLVCSL